MRASSRRSATPRCVSCPIARFPHRQPDDQAGGAGRADRSATRRLGFVAPTSGRDKIRFLFGCRRRYDARCSAANSIIHGATSCSHLTSVQTGCHGSPKKSAAFTASRHCQATARTTPGPKAGAHTSTICQRMSPNVGEETQYLCSSSSSLQSSVASHSRLMSSHCCHSLCAARKRSW